MLLREYRWPRVGQLLLETVLLLICAQALGACGGNRRAAPCPAGAPAVPGFDLPDPASLPRAASYESEDRYLPGRSFSDTLPANLVEVDGSYAVFSPNWSATSHELAYCMFDFSLEGFDEAAEGYVTPAAAPEPGTGVFLGLANWDRNNWVWHAVPADGRVELGGMDGFVGEAGRILAVVAATGVAEYTLASLIIGPPLNPIAVLVADPMEGDAPLTVTFDATDSYDLIGAVTDFRWDLEDEGKFVISPNEPIQVKTFNTPGPHRVGLAAISDLGYWGYTWITIEVFSDWSIEQVDDYGHPGHYGSLELDSAGRPHIASFMADWEGEIVGLHYARYDGAEWQTEAVSLNEGIGEYTSLALDSGDHPHIACYDSVNECLMHVQHTGTEWELETVDDTTQAGELGTSIRIDNLGHPCISYYGDQALKFARSDGAAWALEQVDADGWPGTMSSLALDDVGDPHIAYRGSLGLRYAWHDGADWHTEHVDESAGGGDREISLALDGLGHPHIAYGDSNLDIFKYACHDGSDWTLTVLDDTAVAGVDCSLALDALGHPHIAYCCVVDYDDDLMYASFDGADWQLRLIADTGSVGRTPSLELDALDQPRVSFHDGTRDCLMYMWIGDH